MTSEEQIAKLNARVSNLETLLANHQQALVKTQSALQQIHQFQQYLIKYLQQNEDKLPGSGPTDRKDLPEEQEGET